MARSYKGVRVKKNRVYSVSDLREKYGVSANTVTNWVNGGLRPSDKLKPYIFQGVEVQRFHKDRLERTRINLRPGEFKCIACKAAVFPEVETVQDMPRITRNHMFSAVCPDCNANMMKLSSDADRAVVQDCRNPNTSRWYLHEGMDEALGGIWISKEKLDEKNYFKNDRLLFAWQKYAGRYDEKTIDQHIAAIRYCERIIGGKCFQYLTTTNAGNVRLDLKRRAKTGERDFLSASTIKHIASHLKAFVSWLIKQEGFKRLPADLADYLDLPKAALSSPLAKAPRPYLSIEEAEIMLIDMLDTTLLQKRDRAVFALAFLGALRADTIISLQIKHFDIVNRRIIQDAAVVRSKYGKSLSIVWFPIPDCFENEVIGWKEHLISRGFLDEDPLFPNATDLSAKEIVNSTRTIPFSRMTTIQAVTKAFASARGKGGPKYTPHSAKDTLAAERDARI